MRYRLINLAVLLAGAIGAGLWLSGEFWQCPIRTVTGVRCPTCGMTGAVRALFKGNFQSAWQHNPFVLPLAVVIAVAIAALLWGIVRNRDLFQPLFRLLARHYKLVLGGVALMTIINNI